MKRITILSLTLTFLLLSAIFLLVIGFYFFLNKNIVLEDARESYPFGEGHTYILQHNHEVRDENGVVVLPEGLFYTFLRATETEQSPFLSGRQIGGTAVDLEPYLNKEVIIEGYFSESPPMFLRTDGIPDFFQNNTSPTLHIEAVELVEGD